LAETLTFFDANCVVGGRQLGPPETQLSVAELLEAMDLCGIERALVTHSHAVEIDVPDGNARCRTLASENPRFVPCFVALPGHTGEFPRGEALLRLLYEGGARAVRLFPKRHRYSLLPPWGDELLETLEEANVPVFVDAAEISYEDLHQVLLRHPELRIVLLRPWYRVDRWLYPLLEAHSNLSIEISFYQPFRGLEALASRFGATRLLFGTGMPQFEPGATVAAVRYADLPWQDLQKIAHENLETLLWRPRP